MTEKRFTVHIRWYSYEKTEGEIELKDNGQPLLISESVEDVRYLKEMLNDLHDENEQLKHDATVLIQANQDYRRENEQLKKELHLMHIRTMFSTVQSFKGDVSKRYKYSKETDTVYDTANNYGQYDKVLDKAEIVMLLNEYETILNELKNDVEGNLE